MTFKSQLKKPTNSSAWKDIEGKWQMLMSGKTGKKYVQ